MAKDQQQTDMTPEEAEDRIWELAKKIDICMFVTWDGERQRARPLSARVHRDEHAIYFLVDEEGHKNEQVEAFPIVTMTWTDSSGYKYVSMTGKATVTNDRVKIKQLWERTDKAWWDDENDPSIRLLTVSPDDAELWDSPNQLIATSKMLFAAVTGAKPDFGDNAKVEL
jgi:general stress protein 26